MTQTTKAYDVGTTHPDVLYDLAVVLAMVNDHFCIDRESELAQVLQTMVNTCFALGNCTPTTTTSAE